MEKIGRLQVFKTKKERDNLSSEKEKQGYKVYKTNYSHKVHGFAVILYHTVLTVAPP